MPPRGIQSRCRYPSACSAPWRKLRGLFFAPAGLRFALLRTSAHFFAPLRTSTQRISRITNVTRKRVRATAPERAGCLTAPALFLLAGGGRMVTRDYMERAPCATTRSWPRHSVPRWASPARRRRSPACGAAAPGDTGTCSSASATRAAPRSSARCDDPFEVRKRQRPPQGQGVAQGAGQAVRDMRQAHRLRPAGRQSMELRGRCLITSQIDTAPKPVGRLPGEHVV